MEFKVRVEAPELAEALKYLADAIAGKTSGGSACAGAGGQAVAQNSPCQNVQAAPIAPASLPAHTNPLFAPAQASGVPIAPVPLAPAPIAPAPVVQGTAVPVAATSYSLEQLSVAATTLMDAGKLPALKELLAKYGVPAMTMLKTEMYGAFATDLRALGARI